MTQPKKKWIIGLGALILVLLVIRIGRGCSGREKGEGSPRGQVVPVTVAAAAQKAVPVELRAFGTVQSLSSVAIKSQIGGILTSVNVKDGQDVKQGDLLATVDPRPQQAVLKGAEANMAKDTAQFQNAEKELARQQELLKKGMAAEDAYDQAKAAAESFAAVVQADEAAIANAKLQLEYCEIRTPISGRAGEQQIHQGNLVKADDATLMTIKQITPIEVSFSLPQQQLPRIQDAMAKSTLNVLATIPGEVQVVETGEVTFVDNEVDRQTGTIRLKGTFPNADQRLWPGQFVSIVLTLSVQADAIVIPAPAIQTSQKGSYVFVVKPDQTVEDRPITVDRDLNGETVVSGGLKAGERVVTDGQLRLIPGAKIDIKSAREPGKTAGP